MNNKKLSWKCSRHPYDVGKNQKSCYTYVDKVRVEIWNMSIPSGREVKLEIDVGGTLPVVRFYGLSDAEAKKKFNHLKSFPADELRKEIRNAKWAKEERFRRWE